MKRKNKMNTEKLSEYPNIGKEVERQLNEVGITTIEELKALGAEQAWLKIQSIDDSACINRLLALEGAIRGIKKTLLPDDRKNELKEFYSWNKK
jgi:DNA transformation protein